MRIGNVPTWSKSVELAAGHWPGRVDKYLDLYVAGVWNIFRSARLLLISLVLHCTSGNEAERSRTYYQHLAEATALDLLASVPYHLAENLAQFLDDAFASQEIKSAGPFLGGLLLMHPLFIASRVQCLPESMREYMRTCLLWIGTNMGCGQATLFAQVLICPLENSLSLI